MTYKATELHKISNQDSRECETPFFESSSSSAILILTQCTRGFPAMKIEYISDGSRTSSLEAFYDEISRVLIPNHDWGRNLDAFDDILRGGFGTPDEGFTLKWRHSAI